MITTENTLTICLNSLNDSWKDVELIIEDMCIAVKQSDKTEKGFHDLYHHFSEQTEVTIEGFGTALRRDHTNAILRYLGIEKNKFDGFKKHFALYHPKISRTDLPGFYLAAIKDLFRKRFPCRN